MARASRERDEMVLDWLRLRDKRLPIPKIAKRYGFHPRNIEQILYRIRRDDKLAHEE